MILYTKDISIIQETMLEGFFKGWPNPPSKQTHLRILQNSSKCIIARDQSTNKVVGFITAITDQTLCAYVPLLEVLESYQNKGIGKKLVELMLADLKDYYMIDIVCDSELFSFYEKFKMNKHGAMIIRNYPSQSGIK